jgi:hypothetical protein
LLLAASAFALSDPATAAPPEVRTPAEVRTDPTQFIVVAVANPVTGRPAAVGGTAHGYGTTTNYRVSATARSTTDTCRTLGIWIVSLGLGWERLVWPYSGLQVLGFALLV